MSRRLYLEDGSVFEGMPFGASPGKNASGDGVFELVFNTSMAGYPEILTDPSYAQQAVVMTFPLIGNYGVSRSQFEADRPHLGALIVRECCRRPSHAGCEDALDDFLRACDIPGLAGADTRRLTRRIRDFGSMKCLLTDRALSREEAAALLATTPLPRDVVARVSPKEILCTASAFGLPAAEEMDSCFAGDPDRPSAAESRKPQAGMPDCQVRTKPDSCPPHVVVIDCGMKRGILRALQEQGCTVTRVPWNTSAARIRALRPDGVLISNGPGNPQDVPQTIGTVRALLGTVPVFGICLGHQILSLAYGADTYKLKFGHRGGNHPVRDVRTGSVDITSQNHSYAVDADSLKNTPLSVTHINLLDGTVEGVACERDGAFSVQFHPEGAPGPNDSRGLFRQFIRQMEM